MPEPAAALVAVDEAVVAARAAALAAAGWRVQAGFDLPEEPWDQSDRRLACRGMVGQDADVAAAVLAAARGCLVLAVTRAPDDVVRRLVADLARVGPVEHRRDPAPPEATLDSDQRALLALLGEGRTTAEAARERHLSTRSAERRLAAARAALGVRSTAEAVARLRTPEAADPEGTVHP